MTGQYVQWPARADIPQPLDVADFSSPKLLATFGVGLNPIDVAGGPPHANDTATEHHPPNEMADAVKAKVRAGEYATESEVIRDGLRALLARDRAVESWLHHQVGLAYDAQKVDPSRAVTADQVRAHLAAEHAKAR